MKGTLYINGIDAYTEYGVFVEQNGYTGIVQYPPLKKVDSNSWPEEDGIEPDLSSPVLDSKQFDLSFVRLNDDNIEELLDLLGNQSYNTFYFTELGQALKLRLVSQADKRVFKRLERFKLKFEHDFPLENYEYQLPVDLAVTQVGYEIDAVPLASYGVWILDGSDEEISKTPAVKKNLLVNLNKKQGVTYFGENVVFESKDVTLKCLLKTKSMEIFWRNYMALLYDLTQPEERIFFTDRLYEEYPCHYKNSKVNKFDILKNGTIWCEFTLTLVFTSFRVNELCYLLDGEDDTLKMDEEGINYIDVKLYGN